MNSDKSMEMSEKKAQLATRLLECCRDSLLINMRYLDMALNMLRFKPVGDFDGVTTEGRHLFFSPDFVLNVFSEDNNRGAANTRLYLHTVLHCVFKHMFVALTIDTELWDLACDIAVAGIINELDLPCVRTERVSREETELFSVTTAAKGATAERIYTYLSEGELGYKRIRELKEIFEYDSHVAWYKLADADNRDSGDGDSGDAGADDGDSGNGNGMEGDSFIDFFKGVRSDRGALSREWGDIARRMEQELENFIAKRRGDKAGNLTQNLKEMNRERYDYTAFLKKFAVRTEVMKTNDDEFDYVYYTYGLKLYENMPLIEPLEYRDDKRIREFVIALDTSGSTSGEMVQKFFNKTFNIMKSADAFGSKIKLYIIQCDSEIQEVREINSLTEFDEYIKNVKVRGLGGTDFRPVFEKIRELQKNGELTRLKGMIYFTDGCGVYPRKKPPYDTAFVFIEDEYNDYDVPPWAIKLVLKKEEL